MPVKKVTSDKKQVTSKKEIATKPMASRNDKMSIPVYSLVGRAAGSLSLPKEVFGATINQKLLAQALRVYMTNQKNLTASTKGRGEVHGTTAKMYKQKGTGRARHGAKTAPIFVGGGVAFGPKTRNVRLDLPKKMKKRALIYALSSKMVDGNIIGLSGGEKASGKTKEFATFLDKLKIKNALIVTEGKQDGVVRGSRNIQGVSSMSVSLINAYEVLKHQHLIISKEAIDKLKGDK